MLTPYDHFREVAATVRPATAIVLGSGLGSVLDRVTATATVRFADIPAFPAPTVHGHGGKVVVGTWGRASVLLFQGRVHFYEGHDWDKVVAGVRLASWLGVSTLVLTNAAGGIHPDLNPGDLMVIRNHLKLVTRAGWRAIAGDSPPDPMTECPYSPRLVERLQTLSAPRPLLAGTYAALTGPCYETPAEIRALRQMGADAVGMSTAMEAQYAATQGLEVAAISCITNKAAGLGDGPLDHKEVLQTAAAPADRLADLLAAVIGA